MTYAVYFQEFHHRWAGYGVPGICDHPKCGTNLNRGLYFLCEEHLHFAPDDVDEEDPISTPGCELFFCERHQGVEFEKHFDWEPKPDTKRWMKHMLTDYTWSVWRNKHPEEIEMMQKEIDNDE